MKIAFVGIEKDWEDLKKRDYIEKFIKYHLELPWYYSEYGDNDVWIVTDDSSIEHQFDNGNSVITIKPDVFMSVRQNIDVVIHWRKWIDDCYCYEAVNVINSQDHSYSGEWLASTERVLIQKKLDGILCFPEWHEKQLTYEFSKMKTTPLLLSGVTLGVDTDVYTPSPLRYRRTLLWASDPGRGLINGEFLNVMYGLYKKNKLYTANVCYPDYVNDVSLKHPAINFHANLDNGEDLWSLFNTTSFLPYTSTFKEPSSRAHRQAMAAGCIVLYPPDMGTPSDLIMHGENGFVCPVDEWEDIIETLSNNDEEFDRISKNARKLAVSENWQVQAKRFNKLFERLVESK